MNTINLEENFPVGMLLINDNHKDYLYVANGRNWVVSLFKNVNAGLNTHGSKYRAATKEEIFADLKKNGWKVDGGFIESPSGYLSINVMDSGAHISLPASKLPPSSELALFGHECIRGQLIIDALNLLP